MRRNRLYITALLIFWAFPCFAISLENPRKAAEQGDAASQILLGVTYYNENNYAVLAKVMSQKNRPDGLIASVEKLTTPIYAVCKNLHIAIPQQLKVISFSNLETALILNPSLTTITQPAFEMGKAAAAILLKSIEKKNYQLVDESIVIPSVLLERESTG